MWRQRSPWVNDIIKSKSKWKNSFYKIYKKNNKSYSDYELLIKAVSEVSNLIEKLNNEYYYFWVKRLNEPSAIKRNSFFFEIRTDNIGKVIRAISLEKSHNHREISIRVLNLSESIISEPLYLTLKIYHCSSTFSYIGKKRNEIPQHKKAISKFFKNTSRYYQVAGLIFTDFVKNV